MGDFAKSYHERLEDGPNTILKSSFSKTIDLASSQPCTGDQSQPRRRARSMVDHWRLGDVTIYGDGPRAERYRHLGRWTLSTHGAIRQSVERAQKIPADSEDNAVLIPERGFERLDGSDRPNGQPTLWAAFSGPLLNVPANCPAPTASGIFSFGNQFGPQPLPRVISQLLMGQFKF